MSSNLINLGDFKLSLEAARRNALMTQSDVCEQVHIGKNTLVNIEKNRVQIDEELLITLCSLYHVPDVNLIFLPLGYRKTIHN